MAAQVGKLDPNVTQRSAYYKNWDAITKDAVKEVEDDDKKLKTEGEEQLGAPRRPFLTRPESYRSSIEEALSSTNKGPKSEAEAKDIETRAALKKAKALWSKREKADFDMNKDLTAVDTQLTVTREMLEGKRVLTLKDCVGATIVLPVALERNADDKVDLPIKIFLQGCKQCEVVLECALITSFVELNRCEGIKLYCFARLHTVQTDLCSDLDCVFAFWDACYPEGPKIYHAATKNMKIDAGDGRVLVISGEDVVCDETASTADEVQFVTSTPYGDARILTERVLRLDNRFVTQRELDDQLVATGAVTQMPTAADNVEHEKRCGNQAFGNREYAQAAVHYTMAIDKMKRDGDGAREILLCNRSACFLKLGELEKAVDDAAQAALLNPGYCKAHFRHGLALHAQGKYREALPALGKALNMEPKNKQILDAVRFAEMRCARGPEVV